MSKVPGPGWGVPWWRTGQDGRRVPGGESAGRARGGKGLQEWQELWATPGPRRPSRTAHIGEVSPRVWGRGAAPGSCSFCRKVTAGRARRQRVSLLFVSASSQNDQDYVVAPPRFLKITGQAGCLHPSSEEPMLAGLAHASADDASPSIRKGLLSRGDGSPPREHFTGRTFLVENIPGSCQVRVIGPNAQDSEGHIVERSPKHRGLVFNVPAQAGDRVRIHLLQFLRN